MSKQEQHFQLEPSGPITADGTGIRRQERGGTGEVLLEGLVLEAEVGALAEVVDAQGQLPEPGLRRPQGEARFISARRGMRILTSGSVSAESDPP